MKRSEKPEETREAGGDAVRTREDGFNRQRRSRERKNREKRKEKKNRKFPVLTRVRKTPLKAVTKIPY